MPAHVRDNVWIGSVGAASNGAALRDKGITHVLSLCPDELPRQADVHYHLVQDLPDAPAADLRARLPALCNFIQDSLATQTESSEPAVLVNCFQGKSRSAAVVAAFLIRKHGLTVVQGAIATRQTSLSTVCSSAAVPHPTQAQHVHLLWMHIHSPHCEPGAERNAPAQALAPRVPDDVLYLRIIALHTSDSPCVAVAHYASSLDRNTRQPTAGRAESWVSLLQRNLWLLLPRGFACAARLLACFALTRPPHCFMRFRFLAQLRQWEKDCRTGTSTAIEAQKRYNHEPTSPALVTPDSDLAPQKGT